jgi:hypothetical protein
MSRILVHIDHLVLPRMEIGDRKALVEALRDELTHSLSDPAARADWARPHRTPVLRLGRIPQEPGISGWRKFGALMARSLGKGLKP